MTTPRITPLTTITQDRVLSADTSDLVDMARVLLNEALSRSMEAGNPQSSVDLAEAVHQLNRAEQALTV